VKEDNVSLTATEQATPITSIKTSRPSRHITDEAIQTLATSMTLEGVRHPVLLMPNGELLDGQRRIAAAAELGWTTIPAKFVHTVEAAVDALYESNDDLRLPRTLEEAVDLGLTIETLDHEDNDINDYLAHIGGAVLTSGSAYKRGRFIVQTARSKMRPRHVVDVAKQMVTAYGIGDITLSGAYNRVSAATKASVVDVVSADDLPSIPVPSPAARSPRARKIRMDWIRALAEQGATSAQIAQRVGVTQPSVKKICKDMGVDIPADTVLSRTQRRPVDHARALRVAGEDLDALVWSLEQVDVSVLTVDEAKELGDRFTTYSRAISRMAKKLKGVSR
jgi:hypothetical protein